MPSIYNLIEPEYLTLLDPRKPVVDLPTSKWNKEDSLYSIWFLWKEEVRPKKKGLATLQLWSRFTNDRADISSSKQFERMIQCMYKSKDEFIMCRIYSNSMKGNKNATHLPKNKIIAEMVGVLDYNVLDFSFEQMALFRLNYIVPYTQQRGELV